MYKVYSFLTKNPIPWGVFSRLWTTGNEKSLHSAPHHNRPSHITVTIKWTFFHPLYITRTPLLPHTHHTNPSHSTLHLLPSLTNLTSLSTLSALSYIFSILSVLFITHHNPYRIYPPIVRNPLSYCQELTLPSSNHISQSSIQRNTLPTLSNIYSFNSKLIS